MPIATLDPSKYALAFKGIPIKGFMDGTFITIERNNPMWKLHEGGSGLNTRIRNPSKAGKVTFVLSPASDTNRLLSLVAKSDEDNGDGIGSMRFEDNNGTSIAKSKEAFLEGYAKGEYGTDAGPREWVVWCDVLDIVVGGLFQ